MSKSALLAESQNNKAGSGPDAQPDYVAVARPAFAV